MLNPAASPPKVASIVPRIGRIVWPGVPYHVTHRGNRRGSIFFRDSDRTGYLALLRESAAQADLRVWAYALMSNHVHLLVVAERADSMARGIGNAHRGHSRRVHSREGWTGHLWAHRFYSTPLDDAHLWAAVRYIELNPVRAALAPSAEEYAWSSARSHTNPLEDPLLDPKRPFPGEIADWGSWLREGMQDPRAETIRRNTASGRPTGSALFVRELEERLGRDLLPRKRGPKPETRDS